MKYETMLGDVIDVDDLPKDHRDILRKVRDFLKGTEDPDEVSSFVQAQGLRVWGGLAFRERRKLPLRRVLRDLEARRLVELGFARVPTYREQLEAIIEERFDSVAEFCDATELSASFVSHVLKGDKNVSLESLERAVAKIGFRITLEPVQQTGRKGRMRTQIAALKET